VIKNKLNKNIRTKICIIGSGIGGGTVAQKLYEKNREFTIIEAGEFSGNSENVSY